MLAHLTLAALGLAGIRGRLVDARTITIVNSCGTKIFPAYASSAGALMRGGSAAPAGWEIEVGGKTVLDLPDTWTDGRIWIRSGGEGCAEDVTKCLIGQCQSSMGLKCDGTEKGGLGRTLAEFGLAPGQDDFYDVSMVEAFTVAMTITPSDSSCPVGSCGVDADPLKNCDARLAWPAGSDQIWGCANPCMAKVQFASLASGEFNYLQSPSCCMSSWTDEQCTHDVIPFYQDLKKLCKMGYVYAKDDLEMDGPQSAVHNCPSKPSYTLEICSGGTNTGLVGAPSINDAVAMDPGPGGQLNVGGDGGSGSGTPGGGGGGNASSSVVGPVPTYSDSSSTASGSDAASHSVSASKIKSSSAFDVPEPTPSDDGDTDPSPTRTPGTSSISSSNVLASPSPSLSPPPIDPSLVPSETKSLTASTTQSRAYSRTGGWGDHHWAAAGIQTGQETKRVCNKKRRMARQTAKIVRAT